MMQLDHRTARALQEARLPRSGPGRSDSEWTRAGRTDMDTNSAITRLEAAVTNQVLLAAGEPAVDTAAQTLLASLGPALRQLAFELAEQAAAEVAAQVPEYEVQVTLQDGEPSLMVRPRTEREPVVDEDFEARLTLRLPPSLKSVIEEAAGTTGESVNAWTVKTLSKVARHAGRPGKRMQGTIRT